MLDWGLSRAYHIPGQGSYLRAGTLGDLPMRHVDRAVAVGDHAAQEDGPYPATTVLRSPGATDFAASVEWLRTALTEKAVIPHDLRAIGSPDTENLTTWIEKIAADKPRGLLRNVDLVIVSDTTHTGRIRQALSQSGANLTFIDPAVPIPQVKERLQKEGELVVCRVPAPSGEESKKGEG